MMYTEKLNDNFLSKIKHISFSVISIWTTITEKKIRILHIKAYKYIDSNRYPA